MSNNFWKILFVLAATVGVFMLGCSDEDDENPPPATPRVVGVWDADSTSVDSHGVQQITYYFYSDYTYRYYVDAPPVIDERGDWALAGALNDSIEFHATWRDSVTINETYTWRYDIVEGGTQASDVLHVWIYVEPVIGPPYYLETIFPRTQ